MRHRLALIALAAVALALVAGAAAAPRSKGAPVNEQDAISQALQARGMLTKTPNEASSPREPGSADFLYQAVNPPSGGNIVASGDLEYVVFRVSADQPATRYAFDAGTVILDARAVVTSGFDTDGVSSLSLAWGNGTVFFPPPPTVQFARFDNLAAPVVTGTDGFENDYPQFLPQVAGGPPSAVFIAYGHTGSDPTEGAVLVVLTILPPVT